MKIVELKKSDVFFWKKNQEKQIDLCKNLILLGHGMKLMGHAILDEFFLLIFTLQKNIKPPVSFDFILLIMPFTILISTFFSILNLQGGTFFKLGLIVTALCILCICLIKNFSFDLTKVSTAAFLYLFLNILFVIIEQISITFKLSYDCQINPNSLMCSLPIAFWQDFWTGTAYSALGLWISFLSVANSRFSSSIKIFAFFMFALVVIFQHSKTGLLFLILSLVFLLLTFSPAQRLKLYGTLAILILFDIVFGFWNDNRNTLPGYSTFFQEYANQIFHLGYWGHGYFLTMLHSATTDFSGYHWNFVNYVQSHVDLGRKEQISGVYNWVISADLQNLIFGNLSGAHRAGIPNEIPPDKSNILRPIGIVAWVYDWGLIFITGYLLAVLRGFWVIQIKIQELNLNYAFLTLYALAYFLVSCLPFVTNITGSVLFWIIILHSGCIIISTTTQTKKTLNAQ